MREVPEKVFPLEKSNGEIVAGRQGLAGKSSCEISAPGAGPTHFLKSDLHVNSGTGGPALHPWL